MTTLVIKDLLLDEELDRKAMANVRGGFYGFYVPPRQPSSNPYCPDPNKVCLQSPPQEPSLGGFVPQM